MSLTSVAMVLGLLYFGLGGYVATELSTAERTPIPNDAWGRLGNPEKVSFFSRAGEVELNGWFVEGDLSWTVVLVHGLDMNRGSEYILSTVPIYLERGYSVLCFDLRGHGESGSARLGLGPREAGDVLGALDFLEARGVCPEQVILHGWSLGAVAVLLAAADYEHEVLVVIEDSAYAELLPVLDRNLPEASGFPAWINPGVFLMGRLMYGISAWEVRPVVAAEKLKQRGIPLFILHGGADETVAPSHAEMLHEANPEATLWLAPDVGHVELYLHPEYADRLNVLLDGIEPAGVLNGAVPRTGK